MPKTMLQLNFRYVTLSLTFSINIRRTMSSFRCLSWGEWKDAAESLLTTLPDMIWDCFQTFSSYTGFGGCMVKYSMKRWDNLTSIFISYAVLTYHVIPMQVPSISFSVWAYVPYSGKVSREKTFTVLWLFAKVFSTKFGGVLTWQKWTIHKHFLNENRILPIWKFSPLKVSRYTVLGYSLLFCSCIWESTTLIGCALVVWSYIAEPEIAKLEHVYFPNRARSVLEWHLFIPCSMLMLPQPTRVMEVGRWSFGWLTWEQVSSLDSLDLVGYLVVRCVEMDWWL